LATWEWGILNTPDTRVDIASVAKSFTAILVLQLHHEGKLKLDDSLAMDLPRYLAEAS
jgi:CubicO group peptidase (beta-lactamase class C family)